MATAIPASEPASAQVSFTASTLTVTQLASSVGLICATGSNLTAYNRTMVYKVYKNGSAILSAAMNCRALQAWQFLIRSLTGIVSGDVISIKFWTGNATWLDIDDSTPAESADYATTSEAIAYAIALG